MFSALQSDFAGALLDPEKPVPVSLTAHTGPFVARRFAVYRNNVVFSLMEALRDRFPAVSKIVGEEFFSFAARSFVRRHPPRSPLMMQYGEQFPDFLAAFEPSAELPYLPDVARIETARTRAYHAADQAPVAAEAFAKIAPDDLFRASLSLHPSLTCIRSRFPAVTVWAMNSGEQELDAIDETMAEDALVMREELHGGSRVTVRLLAPGAVEFLECIEGGNSLGEAVESASSRKPEFNLAETLAMLLAAGGIVSIHSTHEREGISA